jgi:dTDP-4-dehydrorhamnose reductase
MKILVTGASGQLARALSALEAQGVEIHAVGRPVLDLESEASVRTAVERARADIVVNAGAYTGVDKAEDEPDAARRVNALGAGVVARVCEATGTPLIHISTDYVFAGDREGAWREDDTVGPQGIYGATKLEGEELVAQAGARHVILRTAWVYSHEGTNFVRSILKHARTRPVLDVVNDQYGSPTYAPDLAGMVVSIARRLVEGGGVYGVFHAAGGGSCSRSAFAQAILEEAHRRSGPHAEVRGVPTSAYPTRARRPVNSTLDCTRMREAYCLELPPWRASLSVCMDRIAAAGFSLD